MSISHTILSPTRITRPEEILIFFVIIVKPTYFSTISTITISITKHIINKSITKYYHYQFAGELPNKRAISVQEVPIQALGCAQNPNVAE